MKRQVARLLGFTVMASAAFAGTEYSGKEMKQVAAPPPCPEWYADREFNVGIWGTYVFTGNNWQDDRYIEADHAWGGGLDLKYFLCRYFGVGLEGWAIDARQAHEDVFIDFDDHIFQSGVAHETKAIGSVLGTLTLRYPIPCTRFAPYIWGGSGAIFGGGQRTHLEFSNDPHDEDANDEIVTRRTGSETRAIGQFGGGMEIRLTPHIGWTSDFSWNVVGGPHNNFGMVRTGLNFAF